MPSHIKGAKKCPHGNGALIGGMCPPECRGGVTPSTCVCGSTLVNVGGKMKCPQAEVNSSRCVAPFGYPAEGGSNIFSNHSEAPECRECCRPMIAKGLHYVCANPECRLCGEDQVPPQDHKDGIN